MYNQNPRVRDAQNPYRTGVLIGNCWEDKFGMELATKTVSELIAHLVAKQVSPSSMLSSKSNCQLTFEVRDPAVYRNKERLESLR